MPEQRLGAVHASGLIRACFQFDQLRPGEDAMPSPKDAAIATIAELNKLTAEFGAFSIAENATDQAWIKTQQMKVQAAIAKTKSELRRLENALVGLEHEVNAMGRDGSTQRIEREYTPLEGWALTLIDNYATLVGMLSHYDRKEMFGRLSEYTRGMIIQGEGGNASHTLGRVRAFLGDKALFYR
jgi:hypothetical protein